jgi:hypothetical protein
MQPRCDENHCFGYTEIVGTIRDEDDIREEQRHLEGKKKPYRAQCRHGVGYYDTLEQAEQAVESHNFSCQSNIPIIDQTTGKAVNTSSKTAAELEYSRWLQENYHIGVDV